MEHVTSRDTDIIVGAEHELLASRLTLKREGEEAKVNEMPEDQVEPVVGLDRPWRMKGAS